MSSKGEGGLCKVPVSGLDNLVEDEVMYYDRKHKSRTQKALGRNGKLIRLCLLSSKQLGDLPVMVPWVQLDQASRLRKDTDLGIIHITELCKPGKTYGDAHRLCI